jgi:hypothetical protein
MAIAAKNPNAPRPIETPIMAFSVAPDEELGELTAGIAVVEVEFVGHTPIDRV